MNHKLFTTLAGLSISTLLLGIGLMADSHAQRLSLAVGDGPLVEAIEGEAEQAADETVAPRERKQRRGRASLSMPYFSFAQSLRPRG
ncbi:MAG: hypothetical protein EON92_05270 [Burkholderiales bacterium]|nr:MAG: hypothetical protein EON92_05270 [Burkholderiales bacterium]